jgi:hypothetical protein
LRYDLQLPGPCTRDHSNDFLSRVVNSIDAKSSGRDAVRPASRVAIHTAYIFVFAIVAILTIASLSLNRGYFGYTLDDAYIHLSVSEQIWHGEYGVNPGEFSTPSSSIAFPFILAIAAGSRLHRYMPFILNLAFLFVTLEIIYRFLLSVGFDASNRTRTYAASFVGLAAICFNLIGIAFSGLEHNAHIALTAAIIFGLTNFLKSGRLPWWLPICIIAAPLFRYEGLALSLAAILALFMHGQMRAALVASIGIVVLVGGFSLFLVAHGLPPLPSSVLVKSSVVENGVTGSVKSLAGSLFGNVISMLGRPIGLLAALGCIPATLIIVFEKWDGIRLTPRATVSFVLIFVVVAHALVGKFGWFARYEIYLIVAVAMMLVFLFEPQIRKSLANERDQAKLRLGGAVAILIIGFPYVIATAYVPLASNNIYEQQYQMHRFLTEFHHGAAAVNDLGWTSYRNQNYVLDLWGLGSEAARLALMKRDRDGLDRLVRQHGATVAAIYSEAFDHMLPKEWVKVGSMHLSRPRITPASATVTFYATDHANVDPVRRELESFAQRLPPRLRIDFR